MENISIINSGFSQPKISNPISSISLERERMLVSIQEYERYLTISKGLSPKSIKTYLARFKIFKQYLMENDLELIRNTVENFLYLKKKNGSSNATINTYRQAIYHIEGCYKAHGFKANFMEGIGSMPKTQKNINPLSIDEANKLINTSMEYKNRNGVDCSKLDFKYLTMTEFILFTGCRYDEAASLKISQLDIDNGRAYLTDTKNNENRYIFFNNPVKDHLKDLIRDKNQNELVFTNSKGGKMHSGDFGNNLKSRAKKAGITKNVYPHLLRHTFATLFYNQTHDIAMTATLLGHKDIQVTYDTYVHLDTEGIQQASNQYPLVSQFIPSDEKLRLIKKSIEDLRITNDKRFNYEIRISNNELLISIKAKEA